MALTDKQRYYPSSEPIIQEPDVPGQTIGETSEQFAEAKQNYNIFKPYKVQQRAVEIPEKTAETGEVEIKTPSVTPGTTATMRTTAPAVNPSDPTSGMNTISTIFTSPEQEEKMRRASLANQRILAIGDALRHIGNIASTINYAPSQQFNNPVQEESQRYQQGKALRDAANYKYLTYQQQRAAQDAAQRRFEANLNYSMAKDAANAQALKEYRDAQLKANEDKWKSQLGYTKERDEANRKQKQDQYDKQNAFTRQRIGIAATNSRNAERHRQYIRDNKLAGGGNKNLTRLHTKYGAFGKNNLTATERDNVYNALYEWGKNTYKRNAMGFRGKEKYIDEGGILSNSPLLGKTVTAEAKRRAVDKMLKETKDLEPLLELKKFGFIPVDNGSNGFYDPYDNDLGLEDDDEMDLGLE